MATKEQKPDAAKTATPDTNSTQGLKPIHELRSRHKTGRAVFAGACAVNGWRPGKVMTDEEYLAGIAKFTNGPAKGPGKPKSEVKK